MPARLWSELPPWERRAELAKVHPDLTEGFLIADGLAVPELASQIEAQRSREDKVMVVLRHFGDEGHPQPEERGALAPLIFSLGDPDLASKMRRSPGWGRLPPLEEKEPATEQPKANAPRDRLPGKDSSPNKWEGKPIPHETFWELFRLAVEEEASARSLSTLTDESDNGLAFVNRNKAGNIVKWVKAHPTRARRALKWHELPREFRATPEGVFPPEL
jgi:hypothetical protein